MLLLLSLLLSIRAQSAQDQRQRTTPKGRQSSVKSFSDFPAKKWLDEDVRWIITDQERADFKSLTTDEQRDDFIDAFWEHRNPNPGSEENVFKEEYYARFVYVNERFGGPIPGWKTDRGRIYIVYGPPNEQEQFRGRTGTPAATGNSPPRFSSDVWRYYPNGVRQEVSFVFLDKCDCGEYLLQESPLEKT